MTRIPRRWRWAAAALLLVATAPTILVRQALRQKAPRLAVLPFENLGQPSDEYFADGLTEEISSRLANVPGLGVIGRVSAQEYKHSTKSLRDIAADLHVSYVLSGTVRWERLPDGMSRVRVIPRLVRVQDQTSAWSTSYEGPISDVFAFQTGVAQGIAEAMNVAVPARERLTISVARTDNVEAYDAYLRGLASSTRARLFEPASRQTAINEFQRAAALDPAFAAAHARLALAYVYAARFGADAQALNAAKAHLQAAVTLDSTASETLLARGWYLLERNDAAAAHLVVQNLIRAQPTNSQALYLNGLIAERDDRPEDAMESYQSAEALEPRLPDPPAAQAALYDALGKHAEAVRAREREIALTPGNGAAYFAQATSYLLWRYDTAAARGVLERGIATAGLSRLLRLPDNWMLGWEHVLPATLAVTLDTLSRAGAAAAFPGPVFDDMKVRLYTLTGRRDRARVYADSLIHALAPRSVDNFEVGVALVAAYAVLGRVQEAQSEADATYALLSQMALPRRRIPGVIAVAYVDMSTGRLDLALQRLESLTSLRPGFYISAAILRQDPRWAALKTHPRFEQFVLTLP